MKTIQTASRCVRAWLLVLLAVLASAGLHRVLLTQERTALAAAISSEEGPIQLGGPKEMVVELPGLTSEAKKLEMVLIMPGIFIMGTPREEPGRSELDWPAHMVTITKPFYMGRYEVTQAQWETLMEKNPSKYLGRPNQPVEKVSWRACQKFIRRLNALGQGVFRLPTEAEWEYACRAGSRTLFSFGGELGNGAEGEAFFMVADRHMWWTGNGGADGPKEVGVKTPNSWGLYDMHGNVSEWCWDRWSDPYDRAPQKGPQGPATGWSFLALWENHVFRGGSFRDRAVSCQSAARGREQSFDCHQSLGFRLVREYP